VGIGPTPRADLEGIQHQCQIVSCLPASTAAPFPASPLSFPALVNASSRPLHICLGYSALKRDCSEPSPLIVTPVGAICSVSLYLPRPSSTDAKLFMRVNVSGCSVPRTFFPNSNARPCISSASPYFPCLASHRLQVVDAHQRRRMLFS
jgi:hypothetical protein